jgi:E3 ubiquitin-protein ligase RNF19A
VSAVSVSSGNSRGSERRRLSRFSLRRLFYPGVRTGKSKSRISLDSDSGKSEMSLSPASSEREPTRPVHLVNQTVPEAEHLSLKKSASGMRECPLCLIERPVEDFPDIMTCHHRSCSTCLQTYLKIEITESRINISCPECTEKFHPNDIRNILQNPTLMDKYEDFMVRRVLVSDPDARWCPAPDCG